MREILFRGKRKDNGEWVEGMYYKRTHYYGDPSVKHYIIISTEDLGYDQALEYYEVIPETLGQFTGLKDKNSKKIFEGDIFVHDKKYQYKVFWCDNRKGFYVRGINLSDYDYIGNFYEWNLEVIGEVK